MADKWVLRSEEYTSALHWDGYYTGRKFQHEGEMFAIVSKDLRSAKKYSSLGRAQRAADRINEGVDNYFFTVEKVEVE